MNEQRGSKPRADDEPAWAGRWIPFILVAAAIAALVLALRPVSDSVGRFLYDDMFYYLRVAQFVVAGEGSTFDGVAPTNGYHPLWMVLCILLATFLSGNVLVHAVLIVGAALHATQGYLMYRLCISVARPTVALAVVVFYLFNWRTLCINLCGLETPLAVSVLLAVMLFLVSAPISTSRRAIALGLLLGLAVLARFDLLILAGLSLTWILVDPRLVNTYSLPKRLQHGFLAGGTLMLTLLPWFGFSLSTSGSLLPNSRRAVAHLQDFEHPWTSLSEAPARLMEQLRSGMWWSADLANFFGLSPLVDPSGKLYLYPPFILMVALAVLVLGFLVYRQHASIQIAAPILAYAFIHGGYYLLAHRIEFRYMLPSSALALVAVAALVHAGTERRPRDGTRLALAGVLAIALTFSLTSGILAFQRGYGSHRAHRYQIVAHRAAQWLKTTYPEAVVASFNAGVLSYFSQTELVNLDGVINDEALEAIEHKRLGQYILERRVALLVEEPGQLALNLERFSDSRMLAGRLGPVIETFEDDAQRVIIVQRVLYPEFDSVEGVEAASGDAESSRVSGSAHSPEVTREP